MNLFEIAARQKFRFPSSKGEVTTEQLFELPLQSRSGFDLDSIAKALNTELKQMGEESFVATVSPMQGVLEQKFELVKLIIKTRLDENAAKIAEVQRKGEIGKLEALLERKNEEVLLSLTPEEIQAKLNALKK